MWSGQIASAIKLGSKVWRYMVVREAADHRGRVEEPSAMRWRGVFRRRVGIISRLLVGRHDWRKPGRRHWTADVEGFGIFGGSSRKRPYRGWFWCQKMVGGGKLGLVCHVAAGGASWVVS